MSANVKEYEECIGRDADGVACLCGGYADRDYKMTLDELKDRTCGRDTESYQCCSRAFVCRVCKTRWLGMAEAPEMD